MGQPGYNGSGNNGSATSRVERPWVGIAANANSGLGGGRSKVDRLVQALLSRGIEPRVAWTLGERAEIVEQTRHDERCRCLVAVGGDGTVADLINEQPVVPLAVLRAGTENLFARHFAFPTRPERLAETIRKGHRARLDLGLAEGRRFSLMAGFGFDADVVTRHHRARVGRAGSVRPTHRAAYVGPVLQSSWSYGFPAVTIRVLDAGRVETIEGTSAFLFNLPRYALGLPFAPNARGDDGWLDLVVFRDPGAWRALHYLWLVLRGLHLRRDDVQHRRVRQVEIASDEPVPVQLDGDPGGMIEPGQPWGVEVLPGAVNVLVPRAPTFR
jgi:diacylglycerol kinase family enzyme